ncbi:pyrroline-5-carboxylate reductase [Hyphomicrobium sp. CS1GBMeth3]|uniref:pyrroline-5-carboxylate reductase n=1 Tax=Hyphomicrobium sp. CS1GBMeth3 TaxID=1892845 RepID=UPI00093061D1|nr:pyrroline-5-carboxylate reductase [Hyphomicrobium sp. CS1GBMeth3]
MAFSFDGPLLLVGAGKMGGALLEGLIARGLDPRRVRVQDPTPPAEIAALFSRHGITAEPQIAALSEPPGVIIVAVKPQVMDAVFPPVAALAGPGTLTISIAAGRTLQSFEAHLAPGAPVVRAMPNTPAAIGRGITVCAPNAHVTEAHRQLCEALMAAVGDVAWVANEELMDAVTAVSGSGPAYVFLLAEALEKAAVSAGLDPALARRLARATVSGSGELLVRSELDAAVLRQNVTSPGGTTAAALAVLMADGGLEDLLTKAVLAGEGRSRELAK